MRSTIQGWLLKVVAGVAAFGLFGQMANAGPIRGMPVRPVRPGFGVSSFAAPTTPFMTLPSPRLPNSFVFARAVANPVYSFNPYGSPRQLLYNNLYSAGYFNPFLNGNYLPSYNPYYNPYYFNPYANFSYGNVYVNPYGFANPYGFGVYGFGY
jgi:hypothetical protein